MKNFKKLIITIMLTMSMLLVLTGCGNRKITSEESGKIFYEVGVHQDATRLKGILGNESEEFESILDDEISEAKKSVVSTFSSTGSNISDEELNTYLDAYLEALKRLECKDVTVLNESEDEAELEFKVNYIDIMAIYQDIEDSLQKTYTDKIKNGEYTINDIDNIQDDMMSDVIKMLIDKLNSYVPDNETTFTYTFKKKEFNNGLLSKKEIWMPKGSAAFGMEAVKASLKFNSLNDNSLNDLL